MPKVVQVPGTGNVEFPDSMSDDDIAAQIKKTANPSWLDQAADFGKALWGGDTGGINPVNTLKGMSDTTNRLLTHPIDTVAAMGNAQIDVAKKAEESFKKGDYAEGMRHALGAIIPLFGPQIDRAGDKAGSGHLAEGLGDAAAIGLNVAGPGAIAKAVPKLTRALHLPGNPNATEAAATQFLQDKGVPVSAAAQTGNPFVRGVQKLADSTPAGAYVASKAEADTAGALRSTAEGLADRAHPNAVAPEQAGQGVRAALDAKSAGHAGVANDNYGDFRAMESDPASLRTVQTGTKQQPILNVQGAPMPGQSRTVPVTQDIPMPVDVRAIKEQLQPIADHMQQWMEPAARNASAGFQAIQSILKGPDYIPASVAEDGLGGLKRLARDGDGRNAGLAKLVTPQLQNSIDSAVSAVNPDALDALQKGRAATAAQYSVEGVTKQLRAEPVQTFNQLTWQKDSGIDLLRQVAKETPAELPKVGRAYLDSLFTKAGAQGGFDGAQGLNSQWQNLGPETKKLLYPDALLRGDLDKFFLGAKKLAENPNPSGSGVISFIGAQGMLAVTHPVTGVPMVLAGGAVSKMMHSPAGVRLLTKGMAPGPSNTLGKAAAAVTAGQVLKMAGPGGATPMELPKAAGADQADPAGDLAAQYTAKYPGFGTPEEIRAAAQIVKGGSNVPAPAR